jgi:type IV secretory pathway VirB2 component (pilin)
MVEAMRAMILIVVVGIEWAVGRLSCNSLGVVV